MSPASRLTMCFCGLAWVAMALFELEHHAPGEYFYPVYDGVVAILFFAIAAFVGPKR